MQVRTDCSKILNILKLTKHSAEFGIKDNNLSKIGQKLRGLVASTPTLNETFKNSSQRYK